MTEQFKDRALDFYGIDFAPIVRVEATDLPTITVNDRRMDFLFLLADDTYLHLEFQTTFEEVDLNRFLQYDVSAYELFKKPIQTVVIYGADISNALTYKNYGSVKYETQAVYMKNYDGDQIMRELWTKAENGEVLSEIDELNLIFLPLMNSAVNRSELAKKIQDEDTQVRLMATVIAISDKFIDKAYVDQLLEVLSMAKVLEEFEKRARLMEEQARVLQSQNSIKDYLDVHFGMESADLQKRVEMINDLEQLHRLLRSLYRADDQQIMEDLIEAAILRQENPK